MNTKLLHRSETKLHAFRAFAYPLNLAVLYHESPTRMKKANTFHHLIDIFETFTHFGAIHHFSVASVPLSLLPPDKTQYSPLSFELDQIRIGTYNGEMYIRICTLSCPMLHWEKKNLKMAEIPEYVERRLWTHLKNTDPVQFDTFLSHHQNT